MNRNILSAGLLYATAALLTFDGVMHGLLWGKAGVVAIREATGVLMKTKLPVPWSDPFGDELKVLWLADIANLLTVAAVCLVAAAMPRHAPPVVLILVAVIPATLAGLLYVYGGPLYVANMQAAAAAMIVAAAGLRMVSAPQPA